MILVDGTKIYKKNGNGNSQRFMAQKNNVQILLTIRKRFSIFIFILPAILYLRENF